MQCTICTTAFGKGTRKECPTCKQQWCNECHGKIVALNSQPVLVQNRKVYRVYHCPYCRNRFVSNTKLLSPNTTGDSRVCIIT